MKLKSWIVAHAGRLVGTADQPSPHDLAHAIEAGGDPTTIPDSVCLFVRWRGHDLQLLHWPGAGCWEIALTYAANAQQIAFLCYRDDEQFEASGDNPFYAEHEPQWDRGWLTLLEEATVS